MCAEPRLRGLLRKSQHCLSVKPSHRRLCEGMGLDVEADGVHPAILEGRKMDGVHLWFEGSERGLPWWSSG